MDNQAPVEKNPMYEAAFQKMRRRRAVKKWLRRGGCFLLIVIWIGVLLLPCFFVTLMVQKEIVITHSDLPEHETRLFFLDSRDARGFGLSRGRIESGGADEDSVCIVTSVDYLMWEGEGDGLSYCNCYEKSGDTWQSVLVGGDADCNPVEFDFSDD